MKRKILKKGEPFTLPPSIPFVFLTRILNVPKQSMTACDTLGTKNDSSEHKTDVSTAANNGYINNLKKEDKRQIYSLSV